MYKAYRNTLHNVAFVFRNFSCFARPDRLFLILVVLGIVVHTVSNTALIWLLGMPVTLLHKADYSTLQTVLFWLVMVLLLNQLVFFILHVSMNWLALRFIGRVRNHTLGRSLALSFASLAHFSKGDMLARLSNDVDQIQGMLIEVPLLLVSSFFTLVFYICMLFWIDVKLALIALLFVPLLYLHQWIFAPRKGKASEAFYAKNGDLLAYEEQSLSNLKGISSFNIESYISDRHGGVYEMARRWAMRMRTIDGLYTTIFNLLIYGCGVIIVLVGIQSIRAGDLPLGSLVSFLLYLGYLSVPVRTFAEAPISWQGQYAAARRVYDLNHTQPKVEEKKDCTELQVREGTICLQSLEFSYQQGDEITPVFKNVSLTVTGGQTIALVGPSGSGKSTLAALLMRFYDPQNGSIQIDGTDIRNVSLASLRANIAVVWQNPFMIDDTIEANLRLARPDASEDQIRSACQDSSAWEFISSLKDGLQTRLGSGVDLSVGQRQRLSIAQAFLKNAPILILDEASSSLDSQSEQVLVDSIQKLRQNRTTLIIAHRYSSIRSAQRILYLNGDGTVEFASHEELLHGHSGYKDALQWQTDSKA